MAVKLSHGVNEQLSVGAGSVTSRQRSFKRDNPNAEQNRWFKVLAGRRVEGGRRSVTSNGELRAVRESIIHARHAHAQVRVRAPPLCSNQHYSADNDVPSAADP